MFVNTTKLKRHIGFTLAEVIIVIGILGIIAEVTIPTLVGNAQKQILATQLEKAYSTFPQGLKQYMASTGVTELGDTDLFDGVTSMNDPARQTVVDTAMKKIFKPAKVCYGSDTTCQYNLSYLGWSGLYTFMAPGRSANTYNFCTLDGACYSLNLATACNPNYNLVGPIKAYCGTLYVDTNGTKAPNKVGRDGFEFLLGQDGMIYPEASSAYSKLMNGDDWDMEDYWRHDPFWCGTENSTDVSVTAGWGCAARIQEEGWKINY